MNKKAKWRYKSAGSIGTIHHPNWIQMIMLCNLRENIATYWLICRNYDVVVFLICLNVENTVRSLHSQTCFVTRSTTNAHISLLSAVHL